MNTCNKDERWVLARKAETLRIRAAMIQAVRNFFITSGFLEIETPLMVRELAPESHIDAVRAHEFFLQTSPELCMKRLLSAGYPQLFQISKCFRSGERGRYHLPEFTMLEWYRADADYRELMEDCENLLLSISLTLGGKRSVSFQGEEIELSGPWKRISVAEAFEAYSDISLETALEEDCFDNSMVMHIEPNLGWKRPAFLFDYPLSLGSLARKKADNPFFVERFELYVGGLELANAFSELTDAKEQRERFAAEECIRRKTKKIPYTVPNKFLDALENMPEAAGIALGIDRLAMIFADAATIDDVVAFTAEDL
ncbi:MAG: EF-P lysine aminoacylase EpmA [Syntrophales bacterium]|jgi:lysyl-tRNA synthetase class 2|nr:EF-P lysine aminoacylase EpmA [Syntrophales bacterium]MDY0043236.1 EF-P lysine aminoacylase EpmA [Syntrophales bacterium]